MTGIVSFGAYVPATRLPLALISGRPAKDGGPERAVAAYDEDAITMAVAAGVDALRGLDRGTIDALYLASTSLPYREKSAAALVAKALDLRRDVHTLDLGASLRAGVGALAAAHDAVASGAAARVLVIASDARLAAPRSALERDLGDGAAAFVVGRTDLLATLTARHAVADEIVDVWRTEDDAYLRAWEDRFVVQHGYHKNVVEVVAKLLAAAGLAPTDVARVALAGPDARSIAAAAKAAKLPADRLVTALFGKLGHTGAAFAPMLLVHALESGGLATGDRVACVSHGNGAEALIFTATEALALHATPRGVAGHLARRRPLASYQSYLASRGLAPTEHDAKGGGGVAATVAYRERDAEICLHGFRCTSCGTMHFPSQRVCYRCHARDSFDAVRLSDRTGRVLSYTFDWFFPNPEPPTIAGVVEVGGARFYAQICDARPEQLRCDLPVELVFRRIHEAGGRPNYFWKGTPLGAAEPATGGGGPR